MNETPDAPRQGCEKALAILDYLKDTANITDAERAVLRHFDECPDCARERDLRLRVIERMKTAVENQAEDPSLPARVRERIRHYEARRRSPWHRARNFALVAAALTVFVAGAIAYQLGHLRLTAASREAYITSISHQVGHLLAVGLGDHVHCTVFARKPRRLATDDQISALLGPEYKGLLRIVKAHVPERYAVMTAHRCSYHGRKFVHLAMSGDGNLISLILTRKRETEALQSARSKPAVVETGTPIYEGSVQRFSIAAFETRDHLVYLVSDVPQSENVKMLESLTAPVRSYLAILEM